MIIYRVRIEGKDEDAMARERLAPPWWRVRKKRDGQQQELKVLLSLSYFSFHRRMAGHTFGGEFSSFVLGTRNMRRVCVDR